MPWKENHVADLRTEFVMRALKEEMPFLHLCREYKISTKTGYKWTERFGEEGVGGLFDQSRKPKSSPMQASEEEVCRIVRLKQAHPHWGPKKIRELFARKFSEPSSLSTVKRILKKAGLVDERRRRKAEHCGRIENRIQASAPNEVWTTDFKGWWYSADKQRVEPLTVQDAYSRYVLCVEIVEDARSETVRKSFERLFEQYGLPQTIRSDNGPPFANTRSPLGLSRLSAWWVSQGINLDRIRPGHPEENGGHERMHRDLAREVEQTLECEWENSQPALDVWRRERNEERPHEALGMKVPAELYKKSERKWKPAESEVEYPAEYFRRRTNDAGQISLEGVPIRISTAIAGWDVGLKKLSAKSYSVWFGTLCLGTIDLETEGFKAAK